MRTRPAWKTILLRPSWQSLSSFPAATPASNLLRYVLRYVLTELAGELVGADALLCCCVYALPDFAPADAPDDRAGLVWGGLGLVLIVSSRRLGMPAAGGSGCGK